MSGFAGFTYWENKPVDSKIFSKMMQMIKHRGPDGHQTKIVNNIAFGHALLALKKNEYSNEQPLFFPDNSALIVGDIHLYNRDEILDTLGTVNWFKSYPSNAAIILECYKRFESEFLNLLNGDFAFAIWDFNKNTLFAARDPFGVKPFFYYWDSNKLIFGSEIKQILTTSLVPIETNDEIVGEFLFDKIESLDSTFFNSIYRLKPAHFLLANQKNILQKQYWGTESQEELYLEKDTEYLDKFNEIFQNSILRRMNTNSPVCCDLSGGFDSSSIVVTAADLYNSGKCKLPNIQTLSAIFGNLQCDESYYFESVLEKIPFKSNIFNPLSESLTEGLCDDIWQTDNPIADLQRGMFNLSSKIINELNAKIQLSGVGGDELLHEEFFLRDLAVRKQFNKLLIETFNSSRYSWNSFYSLFWDAFKFSIPTNIKKIFRPFRKNRSWKPPEWATPGYCNQFTSLPEVDSSIKFKYNSFTQQIVYDCFTDPTSWIDFEFLECKRAYKGYYIRYPFVDKNLVEFILSIPFEKRKLEGRWKYFLRKGLSSSLPKEIINRKRKTFFDSYINYIWSKNNKLLKDLVFSYDYWLSEKYVDKNKFEYMFNKPLKQTDNSNKYVLPIWKISCLEIWLQQFKRYNKI